MIDYKSIKFIFLIDLCFKFIYDKIFTLKMIKQICKEDDNLGRVLINTVLVTPFAKIIQIIQKLIINIFILIIFFVVFKVKLFSFNTIIILILSSLNNIISKYIIYNKHICTKAEIYF